jgi:hypothetical protein
MRREGTARHKFKTPEEIREAEARRIQKQRELAKKDWRRLMEGRKAERPEPTDKMLSTRLKRLQRRSARRQKKLASLELLKEAPATPTPTEAWFDGSCEPVNPGGTAKFDMVTTTHAGG